MSRSTRPTRADAAAALIAGRLVELIEANLPGTLADIDSEFLHDLRVGVRRTRSAQRQLRRRLSRSSRSRTSAPSSAGCSR